MVEVEYLFFVEKLGRKKNSKKKHLLTVQLPAHGQERRLPEKVRGVVDLPVGGRAREPADHGGRGGRDGSGSSALGRGGSTSGGDGGGGRSLFLALGLLLLRGLFAPRRFKDLFLGLFYCCCCC